MMSSLLALLLLALLTVAGLGIGLRLLRTLGLASETQSPAEKVIFALPLGLGMVAYLVLILGLAHLAKPLPLGVLLGASVMVGGAGIYGSRGGLSGLFPVERSRFGVASVVIFALLGITTLIGALAPPATTEYDPLCYHLAAPKTFLRAGSILYIPYDHHSNFPFTWQMLYLLMLGMGSTGGAKLCHYLCGVLLVMSVYPFAVRFFQPAPRGRKIGLIAGLIVASTPIVVWEASTAYVDLATALFTWLSLYALLIWHGHTDATARRGWLILSSLLMGLALGTKLTVLGFWGLSLIGIVGAGLVRERRVSADLLRTAALWGGISLLVAAPWFIKSVLYTGNPVYPFFYGIFGGRYWNAQNAALYAADQGKFGFGKAPINLLLSFWQVTMPDTATAFTEYAFISSGFGLSPVYAGVLLAAPLLVRRISRMSLPLLFWGMGIYLFWFFLMQQTRYLIPALPAFALVCADLLTPAAATDDNDNRVARRFGLLLTAASVLWGCFIATARIALPAVPVTTGQITPDEYIARALPTVGQMSQFINQNTPPDVKVALFDEVRGFYLDRDYAWATPNHAFGFFDWDGYRDTDTWLADFKQRGYTILMVNTPPGSVPDDGQRWRVLLPEAVAAGKVRLIFEHPTRAGIAQVYQIQ